MSLGGRIADEGPVVGPVLGGPFTRRLVRCMVIRRFFRLLNLMRGRVDPLGPRSCYEEGKRFGEALCKAYRDQYGIDVRIARIFNSYGPRLRAEGFYGRVVSRFLLQALKGRTSRFLATGLRQDPSAT